jgi:hypothetical protein
VALDFSYQQPVEEQQQVNDEQPIEEVPQKIGYFSPKRSDKLQSFISMQRTVNAALQKDIDQRQQQPTMQPVAEVGGAWEKDK